MCQMRESCRTFRHSRFHTHTRVQFPGFFPQASGFFDFPGIVLKYRQRTNGVRQVERRSFLPAAIQRQSRKVAILGQLRVSFMPVNVS